MTGVQTCALPILRHGDFEKKLEELNTEFEEKLNFRCIGPLPPYSFYTLQIKRMDFKEVEWARKRFGLNNDTNREEVKKAHRALAVNVHPDKNPEMPSKEKEFSDVTKAYGILLDYCRACEQTGSRGNYSFDEDEFKKNSVLVTVAK